jgi:hypothetical protein
LKTKVEELIEKFAMDNPSFICDDFNCSKIIDAEEKLLLVIFENLILHPVLKSFFFSEKAFRSFCYDEP